VSWSGWLLIAFGGFQQKSDLEIWSACVCLFWRERFGWKLRGVERFWVVWWELWEWMILNASFKACKRSWRIAGILDSSIKLSASKPISSWTPLNSPFFPFHLSDTLRPICHLVSLAIPSCRQTIYNFPISRRFRDSLNNRHFDFEPKTAIVASSSNSTSRFMNRIRLRLPKHTSFTAQYIVGNMFIESKSLHCHVNFRLSNKRSSNLFVYVETAVFCSSWFSPTDLEKQTDYERIEVFEA
jgi:hypothetical protein